jgi:hypothetical protein
MTKNKEDLIDKIWENSSHGTRREDIVAAFEAGLSYAIDGFSSQCSDSIKQEWIPL